jgi:hypothetical protein
MARKRPPEASRPGPSPVRGFRRKTTATGRRGPRGMRTPPKRVILIAIMVLIAALLIKRAGTPARIPSTFSQSAGSQHGY